VRLMWQFPTQPTQNKKKKKKKKKNPPITIDTKINTKLTQSTIRMNKHLIQSTIMKNKRLTYT